MSIRFANRCKHTILEADNLPELLREVADFVETSGVVWDVLIDCQSDDEGVYTARVIEYDSEIPTVKG